VPEEWSLTIITPSIKFVMTTTAKITWFRNNLSEVATAAVTGKVDTLLIEAELQIPGMIINDVGSIEKAI
jgi:hypothetical protein